MLNYDKKCHGLCGDKGMIVSYGAKNCWAFKEWMEINFKINKNVPSNIGFKQTRIVPALCFEGNNASGKSCALRVLSFIIDFCKNSFFYSIDDGILYDSFFDNNDKSSFYLTFILGNDYQTIYTYETILDREKVYTESLAVKKGREKKEFLVKRKNNSITYSFFDTQLNGVILKNNSSFISTFIQYGIPEFEVFKDFFGSVFSNVSYSGTYVDLLDDASAARFYYMFPTVKKKVVRILKKFDTGIEDIKIKKGVDNNGKTIYISNFIHRTEEGERVLSYMNQSTGTKLLYNRLRDFITVLEKGGILIFDELDTHLHPLIIPELLGFFLEESNNPNLAQIIFTSHDSSILDIMKKYRTYIFVKKDGESFSYRIDELPNNILLRNDRSLEQIYKSGALGGVPNG